MNKYEGIFIFKSDLAAKDLEEEYSRAEEAVKKHEGRIEKAEKIGKKTLAYAIDKFRDGFFLFLQFEAPPHVITPLRELFKHNNNILRVMITRKEK